MQKETFGSIFKLVKLASKRILSKDILSFVFFVGLISTVVLFSCIIGEEYLTKNDALKFLVGSFLPFIYTIFVLLFFQMGISYLVINKGNGYLTTFSSILSEYGTRSARLLLCNYLLYPLISLTCLLTFGVVYFISNSVIATITTFIVFVYLSYRYCLSFFAIIYDDKKVTTALKISSKLMKGNIFKFSIVCLVISIGTALLLITISLAIIALFYGLLMSGNYASISTVYSLMLSEEFNFVNFIGLFVMQMLTVFIMYFYQTYFALTAALLYLKRRDLAVSTN